MEHYKGQWYSLLLVLSIFFHARKGKIRRSRRKLCCLVQLINKVVISAALFNFVRRNWCIRLCFVKEIREVVGWISCTSLNRKHMQQATYRSLSFYSFVFIIYTDEHTAQIFEVFAINTTLTYLTYVSFCISIMGNLSVVYGAPRFCSMWLVISILRSFFLHIFWIITARKEVGAR